MHHNLKILPCFFEPVVEGKKTFEIRRDDRGFQAGDTVTLQEYDPYLGIVENHRFTGRTYNARIGYVCAFEQKPAYVVFSLIAM